MASIILQCAAVASFTAAAITSFRRSLLAIALGCALAALGLEMFEQGIRMLSSPWAIAATAGLFPLGYGLINLKRAGIAGGVATALLWPASSTFVWQSTSHASPLISAWITGIMMAAILGAIGIALCDALSSQKTPNGHSNKEALALCTMLFVLILPWGGHTDKVPLALAKVSAPFGPAESLRILWALPPHTMPIETAIVAAAPSIFLTVLRQISLAAASITLVLWICAHVLKSISLKQLVTTATTTTALLAMLIPLSAIGVALFGSETAEQLLTLAAEAPSDRTNFRRLVFSQTDVQMHMLGLPVAASLLPALSVALLRGVDRINPIQSPSAPAALFWVLCLEFSAILYMLIAPMMGGGSMSMTQTPWPAILGATTITSTAALMRRYSSADSRLFPIAIWLAFAMLLFALIGPGEGWLVS